MGRIPTIDFHHRHGPVDGLDQGTDAAVFAGVHEAQVFDAGLRVINCVRVQLVEHGIDGHAHQGSGLGILHVELVDPPEDGGQNLEVFGDLEIGARRPDSPDAQ